MHSTVGFILNSCLKTDKEKFISFPHTKKIRARQRKATFWRLTRCEVLTTVCHFFEFFKTLFY